MEGVGVTVGELDGRPRNTCLTLRMERFSISSAGGKVWQRKVTCSARVERIIVLTSDEQQ